MTVASSSDAPSRNDTTAVTASPKSACGQLMTALSATSGISSMAASISGRIDVEPAGDDEILVAADQKDVAARIAKAEIAGGEEAVVVQIGAGLFGVAPIALEHIGALDLDHAARAVRQIGAVGGSVTRMEMPGSGNPTEPGTRSPS